MTGPDNVDQLYQDIEDRSLSRQRRRAWWARLAPSLLVAVALLIAVAVLHAGSPARLPAVDQPRDMR